MKAEVLTIGDELLRGEIVDSNKSFLSDRLLGLDIETRFHTSVCDDPDDMRDALLRAAERSDVVLVSGGLGPTRDDLTCELLAETFGHELVLHEESLEALHAFFRNVGREMAANNEKQAWFPAGAEVLPNPIGTAPGFMLQEGRACFFCMPGVPRELYRMMDEQVLPRLSDRMGEGQVVRAALLRTFGMGESSLDEELSDIAATGDVVLGFRTSFPDNYLRPLARAASAEEADRLLAQVCDAIRERLGPLVYSEGDETLPAVVVGLLNQRAERTGQSWTIALAEQCTGGLLAQELTGLEGSEGVFGGGMVASRGERLARQLSVDDELVERHGAVSEPVARAMAERAREVFGSDLAVATCGVPWTGGSTDSSDSAPDGAAYIALAQATETHSGSFVFPLDRARYRQITAQTAFDWVRRALLGVELVGPTLLRSRGGSGPPAN
ncbi:CinA family nicotinamide mononucleotide deamidase-related protein [Myxococcota bacterium]|nr:CinA family nicotinamide mononucleotide deamidase-related protein [Myxococcota bacterium]